MRATTVLRVLLAFQSTIVESFEFDPEGIIVDVRPTWRIGRCSDCARKAPAYDKRVRTWRHLDLAGIKCSLRYALRRVSCPHCGVCVESVPWAESGSRFTLPFEMHAAYLAQKNDKTTVTKLMRIAWVTVGKIIQRVVRRQRGDKDPLDDLRLIGIDELSYRRHHQYVTVVVNHETGKIVWAAEGKSAKTLSEFFKALGEARCAKLEAVTIDMSGAYIKAVSEASPEAKIIFDRFHVQRLAHDAVDQVRRDEVREAITPEEKKGLKNTRWALLKGPWNLTQSQGDKLVDLQRTNARIYRAYLLKEALGGVFSCFTVHGANRKLDEWLGWASRSRLAPFVKLAKTIRKHRDGIVEYVRDGLNNGRVEGTNGKARTITRRSYGFHSASSLIAMLFLCCGGIHAHPSHIFPFWTH
jgi:transposase